MAAIFAMLALTLSGKMQFIDGIIVGALIPWGTLILQFYFRKKEGET